MRGVFLLCQYRPLTGLQIEVRVRFGLISTAIAAVIGAACFAGSANATQVLYANKLVEGSCVSVAQSQGGCLFVGTINDTYYSNYVIGAHPNSYLDAMLVYNQYVASGIDPSATTPINLVPVGETLYSPSNSDNQKAFVKLSPTIQWDILHGIDPIVDPNNNYIGEVDALCSNTANGYCDYVYNPNTGKITANNNTWRNGTWILNLSHSADFIAVDSGNQFLLYQLNAPASAGTWTTVNLGNTGASSELQGMVFFTSAAAVPEPTTWAMFLLGFGVIGASMRALRRKPALAQA